MSEKMQINLSKNATHILNKYGSVVIDLGWQNGYKLRMNVTKDYYGNINTYPMIGEVEVIEYET